MTSYYLLEALSYWIHNFYRDMKVRSYKHYLNHLAQEMRQEPTPGEALLWGRLKKKQILGLRFYRQYPIDKFIIDFYCRKLKLAIEVDGAIHDQRWNKFYDEFRQVDLEDLGLTFLRFKEEEVIEDIEKILHSIHQQAELLLHNG